MGDLVTSDGVCVHCLTGTDSVPKAHEMPIA